MEEGFFLRTLHKAQRKSVFIFPFILSCFPFVSNATSFFIHVLNRFVLKKNCLHIAGFLQSGGLFAPCICRNEKKTFSI